MKKSLLIIFAVIALSVIALAYAEQKGTMNLKVGYEVTRATAELTANAIQWQATPAIVLAETPW